MPDLQIGQIVYIPRQIEPNRDIMAGFKPVYNGDFPPVMSYETVTITGINTSTKEITVSNGSKYALDSGMRIKDVYGTDRLDTVISAEAVAANNARLKQAQLFVKNISMLFHTCYHLESVFARFSTEQLVTVNALLEKVIKTLTTV